MGEASSTLMTLLKTPSVIGFILMFAIIINILLIIWCTKAYENPYFVLDTQMKINALWRDYTPCGILSMWSGRRQRGWTTGEALQALSRRRAANRRAEAEALALARANHRKRKQNQNPVLTHKPEAAVRFVYTTNQTTKQRAIQKANKINIPKKNVRFMIDDYAKTQEFSGNIKTQKRSNATESSTSVGRREISNTSCIRTSFRKINVTYKRPLPPLPTYTFEDRNVKIVISDIYDRYEIPKSESNQGQSHRYEHLDEKDSRGDGVSFKPRLDDFYESVDLGPFPYTEELEMFV